MAIETGRVEGFAELDRQLTENLPKATQRNVLKKAGTQALEPIRAHAEAIAPSRTGKLKASVRIETAPSSGRKSRKGGGSLVIQVTAGGPQAFYARFQEHGTVKMPANPFMRPAFDGSKGEVIARLKTTLAEEIRKAVARRSKRLAKL